MPPDDRPECEVQDGCIAGPTLAPADQAVASP
jgi:hypothetical protein